MAILEQLRVRAGLLLAIVIGLALLAFVLSDFLDSGGSLFTRSKFEIAEISGKSIPYTDYETRVNELEEIQKLQTGQLSIDEQTMDQIRNVTWENMIQDLLLEKQYAQLFTDPQTGVFNRGAFLSFMQRIQTEEEETDEKRYYLYIENEIFRQRKNTKYLNLIRKGLYATKFEALRQQQESSRAVDLDFIVQNFNTISDSSISITESDIRKYYKENINQFKQSESRDIRYTYFEVVPSEDDFKAAELWINEIKPEFEKAEDVKQFVNMESDESFDEKNYNPGELSDTLNDFMFGAQTGALYGPYFENNAFKISRLAAINFLPDSVKARHILLQATQNNVQTIYQLADSLMKMIKEGADFSMLAMMNSSDGSAQTGGDLGWFREGEMVKAFSDSCFLGKKGDVKLVATQYGIHILEILDQSEPVKQVQVGTVVKNVVPSEETDHLYYVKVNEFAGVNDSWDKFNKAIEDGKLQSTTQTALNLAPMEKRVNDLEVARPLVNWAYKAEEKDVSAVFKFSNRYVVAVVDNVREEGFADLEEIRADIENRVRQQKKSEQIMASMASKKSGAESIEELGKSLGLQVQPVSSLRFTSTVLGNAGVEPNVIAAATSLEKGVISGPVAGENGVYLLSVTNISEPSGEDISETDLARNYIERSNGAKTNYFAFEALKELANIKDNRREFY